MEAQQQGADQLPRTTNQAPPSPAQDSAPNLPISASLICLSTLPLGLPETMPALRFHFRAPARSQALGGGFSRASPCFCSALPAG